MKKIMISLFFVFIIGFILLKIYQYNKTENLLTELKELRGNFTREE
jgi:preprotein translocase subunit SecG